jgi:amidohydrolase
MNPTKAKAAAREAFDAIRAPILALSHRIHGRPELAFEEEHAAGWVADMLDAAGFTVERGVGGLPTALRARAGDGPLNVALLAEYDSLPGIGHACGHNMIAASAVGAAIAAARVADDLGLTITLLGTPAEETGGGKILMLERGVFAGIHAALMIHPAPVDAVEPPTLALAEFDVHYTGRAAHASAFPEHGINAADALTVAQTAIGLLRQHLRAGDRVHGIVTRGGEAANVVPARTAATYMIRAVTLGDLDEVQTKVRRCFEAGALATGATLRIVPRSPDYAPLRHDASLAGFYRRNAESLGRTFPSLGNALARATASTDMGNISQVLPAIHPFVGIPSLPAVNHQPEFAAACVTAAADQAVVDSALSLAWTAIDAAAPEQRERLLR